jgi:aryl-alcohol dehydrogenase-like predicted oxidoreductase
MEYRYLGKTGLKVSALCLGAMTFGREATEADSHLMMDHFKAAGGNFIDTADVYTRGVSEEIVGRWLAKQQRDQVVLATKVRFPMGDGPNDLGLSRKHILDGLEASLKRLGTDYIDLYQVHCWDPATSLEQVMYTLDTVVRSGKVRFIGASNFTGWQLQKAADLAARYGWAAFTCLQPQYNLITRGIEHEVLPVCLNEHIGIIPWGPLKGGWLSGKYQRGMTAPVANTRVDDASKFGWSEQWANVAEERTWRILDALHEVAAATEKSAAQVALRWLLQRLGVTAPIIGARTLKHLEDNMGSVGWQLDEAHMTALSTASTPPDLYPYDFISRLSANRL